MATATFYTSFSDGHIVKDNANYTTCHDAATGGVSYGNTSEYIGQRLTGGSYWIWRFFVFFDTSSIADDATIISATLTFYTSINKDDVDTDFSIVIRNGMPDYPHDALAVGDYLYSHYSGDGGSINTANVSATQYAANVIDLNATGLGWINKTGTTKLALISSRDIDSLIPDGDEYFSIRARSAISGTFLAAKLVVTYDVEIYPTVTTQAASNVGKTYCTANGTLTGGGVATSWGFEYGLTETPTWTITQTGNIGEQAFLLGLSGLESETTYYYRAFATNSKGTAVGAWVSFTTGAITTYGMYEEDNSPTIYFYVRKVGGKWSIKHGPYTADQTNIEITKILVEGTGKYQIKFESSALCSISANIMTKMDIKAR